MYIYVCVHAYKKTNCHQILTTHFHLSQVRMSARWLTVVPSVFIIILFPFLKSVSILPSQYFHANILLQTQYAMMAKVAF